MTTNKPEVFGVYRTKQGTLESVVLLADYKALQAERDHYKNVIIEVTTRHVAERWENTTTDKELEQYLSGGIAQLECEYRKQIEALQAECALLRDAIRRMCNIYVVDDYYDGQLRDERLEAAVNRAINAAKKETNP